jgi:two-component system nitrogen regulation response regulator GlnG
MPTLLIVDDEPNVLYSLEKALKSDALQVVTAARAKQGIELVRQVEPDAVLLDVRLPDMSGLDAFNQIQQIDPRLPVIIITAHATTENAIEAMKRGAFDYLVKPVDVSEIREIVGKATELSRLTHVPAVFEMEASDDPSADHIVGLSAAMQKVYKDIGRVAPKDVNVLIRGESGTGKELVARAIYQHSGRHEAPFLAINCAAIPEALLESELFGHEKGAFTGADRKRIGKFEKANNGTLFLDEIGDMTLALQAKILRLLQDGRFERVGGNETITTDVRIVAATNKDLEVAISDGGFREDLYYRLKVFSIHLPPLRERKEDLPRLVEHFVRLFNREFGRNVTSLPPALMRVLESHNWPGNVRELQTALKYAFVQASGDVITPECLPESVRSQDSGDASVDRGSRSLARLAAEVRSRIQDREANLYHRMHEELERVLLEESLREAAGNQVLASKLLGISRTTLRAKLDRQSDSAENFGSP